MKYISTTSLNVKNPPEREKEIKEINEAIENNQSIILLGTRRVGKTTILNAIEKIKEEKYKIVRYDCMERREDISALFAIFFAYSKKLKIFVSSIGKKGKGELGKERKDAEKVIKNLGHEAFLIENLMDSNPPIEIEEDNIKDADAMLLILGNEYSKNVEDEYNFARGYGKLIFCMIKGNKDDEKDEGVRKIINGMQEEKDTRIYRRYECIEKFKEVIEKTIKRKSDEWRRNTTDECSKRDWREIAEKFFENIKNQNEKFLFLIDEFGEIRKKSMKKDENFEDMLAYVAAKIDKLENGIFVITGSDNVFTLSSQKYFKNFRNYTLHPFEENVATRVLNIILNKELNNDLLRKIIKIFGTVPGDLQLFASRVREETEINDENILKITEKLITEEGSKITEIYFANLDEELINFLKNMMLHLPASEETIRLYFKGTEEKLKEILTRVSDSHFILEKKGNNKYYPYSNFLWLNIVYKNNSKEFNKIIKNILNKNARI